jgi:hypothetical protein
MDALVKNTLVNDDVEMESGIGFVAAFPMTAYGPPRCRHGSGRQYHSSPIFKAIFQVGMQAAVKSIESQVAVPLVKNTGNMLFLKLSMSKACWSVNFLAPAAPCKIESALFFG